MKTLYLDVMSGLSGDMFIGAMLDLGVELHQIQDALAGLALEGYRIQSSRGERAHVAGTKFDVHLLDATGPAGAGTEAGKRSKAGGAGASVHEHTHETHAHTHGHAHSHEKMIEEEHGHAHHHDDDRAGGGHGRNFVDIRKLILASPLSDWVKERAVAIFRRVAVAEGKIHGKPPEEVHFHEVGAVDSIVDIVGACIALEILGKPRVLSGPVVDGTGWVQCAHGRFPVPAPATLEILSARGISITQCDEPNELLTPTGAALLAELAESFGPMQGIVLEKIGYGLGARENRTRPNILRAILGESTVTIGATSGHDWEVDTVVVLETDLDDSNAEILGNFVEKAMALGARDVFHTPIQMKKNRPGVLLTLLCVEPDADKFSELMLTETSAFGVRRHIAERRKLRREFTTVNTTFGEVTVKLGKLDGRVVQATPEYESCRLLADQSGVPLKQIYAAANKSLTP